MNPRIKSLLRLRVIQLHLIAFYTLIFSALFVVNNHGTIPPYIGGYPSFVVLWLWLFAFVVGLYLFVKGRDESAGITDKPIFRTLRKIWAAILYLVVVGTVMCVFIYITFGFFDQ